MPKIEGAVGAEIMFESLNSLVSYYETVKNDYCLVSGFEFLIGHKIGELAVEISADGYPRGNVIDAIVNSTDNAWRDALIDLAKLIAKAAEMMR